MYILYRFLLSIAFIGSNFRPVIWWIWMKRDQYLHRWTKNSRGGGEVVYLFVFATKHFLRSFLAVVLGRSALSAVYREKVRWELVTITTMSLSLLRTKGIRYFSSMGFYSKWTNKQKQRNIGLVETVVALYLFIPIFKTPFWSRTGSTITYHNQKIFKSNPFVTRSRTALWMKQQQLQESTQKRSSRLIYLQMHWPVYLFLARYVSSSFSSL